ncbi:MAG TPA: AI-2E family transporter [Povalibacter sp.]|nr:AI-2E family transporter [Povalibacter sp.]
MHLLRGCNAVPQNQFVTRIGKGWLALVAVMLITATLWAAKTVLVPLALGIVLAFTLSPLVRLFDRMHLPRFLGVLLTMSLTLGAVGGAGYVIADQFTDLATQVTKYSWSMRQKAADLRLGNSATFRQLTRTVDRVTEQLDSGAAAVRSAQPVRVVSTGQTPVQRLRESAISFFEPLASAVIVLVLVAFLLGQREDLRDRLIRLTGADNVTVTTRLINEAAQRVSRFLVAQMLVNIGFGALVVAGLYWIGVPYAVLWGGLTAVLRFVPYVGTMLSAILPACLAFAIFPGWAETLQTLAMFAVLDVATAYIVEPLLFGRRTGVSSFALLVSALYWIWVWGPIGLLLSTPLTVCIAVLGRHVRSLRFLAILFAEEPALASHVRYYQRLLARDEDEAHALMNRKLTELGPVGAMDEVLIPALQLAEHHHTGDEITEEDLDFILEATAEAVGQTRARRKEALPEQPDVLMLGTRGRADRIVLEMLAASVEAGGRSVMTLDAGGSDEVVSRAIAERPQLTCIVAVSATRGSEARALCRRIRAARPTGRLLALRPLPDITDAQRSIARMKEAGADCVAIKLQEAVDAVQSMLGDVSPATDAASAPMPANRLAGAMR